MLLFIVRSLWLSGVKGRNCPVFTKCHMLLWNLCLCQFNKKICKHLSKKIVRSLSKFHSTKSKFSNKKPYSPAVETYIQSVAGSPCSVRPDVRLLHRPHPCLPPLWVQQQAFRSPLQQVIDMVLYLKSKIFRNLSISEGANSLPSIAAAFMAWGHSTLGLNFPLLSKHWSLLKKHPEIFTNPLYRRNVASDSCTRCPASPSRPRSSWLSPSPSSVTGRSASRRYSISSWHLSFCVLWDILTRVLIWDLTLFFFTRYASIV